MQKVSQVRIRAAGKQCSGRALKQQAAQRRQVDGGAEAERENTSTPDNMLPLLDAQLTPPLPLPGISF